MVRIIGQRPGPVLLLKGKFPAARADRHDGHVIHRQIGDALRRIKLARRFADSRNVCQFHRENRAIPSGLDIPGIRHGIFVAHGKVPGLVPCRKFKRIGGRFKPHGIYIGILAQFAQGGQTGQIGCNRLRFGLVNGQFGIRIKNPACIGFAQCHFGRFVTGSIRIAYCSNGCTVQRTEWNAGFFLFRLCTVQQNQHNRQSRNSCAQCRQRNKFLFVHGSSFPQ